VGEPVGRGRGRGWQRGRRTARSILRTLTSHGVTRSFLVALVLGAMMTIVPSVAPPGTPLAPQAASAVPGVPAPAGVVFLEDFENGTDQSATGVQTIAGGGPAGSTSYVAAGHSTPQYTASPGWRHANRCNGLVIGWNNSTVPAWASTPSN